MIKVERKQVVAPPPVEIVMTMDFFTARAVKAAIQVAAHNDSRSQNLSSGARELVEKVATEMYKKGVAILSVDIVNTPL